NKGRGVRRGVFPFASCGGGFHPAFLHPSRGPKRPPRPPRPPPPPLAPLFPSCRLLSASLTCHHPPPDSPPLPARPHIHAREARRHRQHRHPHHRSGMLGR